MPSGFSASWGGLGWGRRSNNTVPQTQLAAASLKLATEKQPWAKVGGKESEKGRRNRCVAAGDPRLRSQRSPRSPAPLAPAAVAAGRRNFTQPYYRNGQGTCMCRPLSTLKNKPASPSFNLVAAISYRFNCQTHTAHTKYKSHNPPVGYIRIARPLRPPVLQTSHPTLTSSTRNRTQPLPQNNHSHAIATH